MKRIYIGLFTVVFLTSLIIPCSADRTASDLLRAGLLGAGAGAIGGAASGAKGRDIWKGALAGVGINIIGGALLDAIGGERTQPQIRPITAYPYPEKRHVYPQNTYERGYQEGYNRGYKEGYTQGLKDGLKENIKNN